MYFGALKNGWQMLDPMPEPRNYHTASLVGDEVFVVGEYQGAFYLDISGSRNCWVRNTAAICIFQQLCCNALGDL